jgi:hypothetical protein
MATYQVGEEIQFRRQITRTNPERVINEDEKGRILAVAPDGSYTVQLDAGDPPYSGITDDDIEPSVEVTAEVTREDTPVAAPPAPADDANTADDESAGDR